MLKLINLLLCKTGYTISKSKPLSLTRKRSKLNLIHFSKRYKKHLRNSNPLSSKNCSICPQVLHNKLKEERKHIKDVIRINFNNQNRQRNLDYAMAEIERADISVHLLRVLSMVGDFDMEEVAKKLFISTSTVAKHVGKLKKLLNLKKEHGMTDIKVLYPYAEAAKILIQNK